MEKTPKRKKNRRAFRENRPGGARKIKGKPIRVLIPREKGSVSGRGRGRKSFDVKNKD